MTKQNFSNHVRRHPIYHFFIVPGTLLLIIASAINVYCTFSLSTVLVLVVAVFLHLIAFLTREYAKKNQDRIILMELRQRYWQLTSKSFSEIEQKLELSQLLALRFAPDEEFLNLISHAISKKMSAIEIKKQIKNWLPDTMRV